MGGLFSSFISPLVFRPPIRRIDEWLSLNSSEKTSAVHTRLIKLAIDPAIEFAIFSPNKSAGYFNGTMKTLVFCHGNGEDIYVLAPWCRYLSETLGVRVVAVEYPGYGPTQYWGNQTMCSDQYPVKPSEYLCYLALEETIKYLVSSQEIDSGEIYLMGRSLGTGVVMDYASKNRLYNPVILISPYKSITRVVCDSVLGSAVGLETFNTWAKLKSISCPVKIFHGTLDEVISPHHSVDIHYNLCDRSLPITWVKGATHNSIMFKMMESELNELKSILGL
jgi:pimeloyl-ACP methyl ester carboxylesterase